MALKPRFMDLIDEYRIRHQELWESLALLGDSEWEQVLTSGSSKPSKLCGESMASDILLLAAIEVASVGLPEIQKLGRTEAQLSSTSPEEALDHALALASDVHEQLLKLDNHQWQRTFKSNNRSTNLAKMLDEVNRRHGEAQQNVDTYLGSFDRLGREGLVQWLHAVYEVVMDSIAGLSETDIMGPLWYGAWNTYQLMEHIWAWNEQALAAARRWYLPHAELQFRQLPVYGRHNPYLGKAYQGNDMIAVADGIVTVYRQTVAWIQEVDEGTLKAVNADPWGGRRSASQLLFDVYRHAWRHAQDIFNHRQTD